MTDFMQEALDYHEYPRPGKLGIQLTKPTITQYDLSLAYTPGVAQPIKAIAQNPDAAYRFTAKGNLVAVISNGTAILGLGDLGPLASKPVMEGKAVLFKHFADIDVFDIEVDAKDSLDFINTVKNIAPTFGGINLEDIAAPDCFVIEKALREQLDIPVFHDDQHGTAIVVAAGLLNALEIQNKTLASSKIVCVGAGAAGIATMRLLKTMGADPKQLFLVDSRGLVTETRTDLNIYKREFAQKTDKTSLEEIMDGADVFIGVARANLLTPDVLKSMADKPVIFALSNPEPEIKPDLAFRTRDDIIMATGRSDYPNQINNVLCFPYMFRGALDAKAREITDTMCHAAVYAIKELAHESVPPSVLVAYPSVSKLSFGPDYIIPKPLDPRLREKVSTAVARAAQASGVCR